MTMREDESTDPFWVEELAEDPPGHGARLRLGLSETFLERTGELVSVELAPAGTRLLAGDTLGFAHTGTRAFDLRAPFALTIESLNTEALTDTRLVQGSSYHRGWLAIIRRD